jgi:hypothetical protein
MNDDNSLNVGKKSLGTINRFGNFQLKISDDNYNILTIIIEPYLLERLLNDQEHWNDACLSFRLNYDRKSNLYCDDTLNALNYLNIRNLK